MSHEHVSHISAYILSPTETGLILMSGNCVRVLSLSVSPDSAKLGSCFHSSGVTGDRENSVFPVPKQPCTKENTGKSLTSVFQQGLRNLFLENCFLGNSASNQWPQKSPWKKRSTKRNCQKKDNTKPFVLTQPGTGSQLRLI